MAHPGDVASDSPVIADYESPYDRYTGPLEDFEAGGIALNDSSAGLDYQIWHLSYDDDEDSPTYGDFTVQAEDTLETSVVLNVPKVIRVGLAFNQNMDPFIAYETLDCESKFYWFDAAIAAFNTSTLPPGSKYLACCLDDHRITQTDSSDIILGYVRAGTLYYRQERDRFQDERPMGSVGAARLNKVGMTKNLRVKYDVREGSGVRLDEIVGDLCALVGVPGNRIDVSPLHPITVRGYKSSGVYTAAAAIRGLQPLYYFDMPQIDGKLVAFLRGGEIVKTITQNDLVADREFRFEDAREQGVEFPIKFHFGYASAETDYTPTKETSERRSRDIKSQSEDSLESAVNHTSQDAAERVHTIHKILWAEFEGRGKFSLPESFAELTPSDPISFEVRENTFKRLRLTRMLRVDGAFDCDAVIDRQSSYTVGTVGLPVTVPPETPPPTIPGSTTWEFMDLPALITAHDTLHFYTAGRGDAGTAWHGAEVQQEVGADWEKIADITSAELMGKVEESLPSAPAEFIDTTNTVLLSLNRAPTSTTTDLMLAGKGAWLIGDEIIQVRDWVAESTNWRGSYLFRGRLDTAPATHAINTRAVFLGNPVTVPLDGSLLDTTLRLRAPSYGEVGSGATAADYSFIGRSQEEWAPEMLTATQNGNDWELSWVPRYRLGNSANPIPSAHFYAWRLKFTEAGTDATRETTTKDPSFTYTEAMQITDFGSAQASFDNVDIRALNYLGGEGKALSQAIP